MLHHILFLSSFSRYPVFELVSRDEWLGASTASSEVHLSDVSPRRPHIFCETAGTSVLLFFFFRDCGAFHLRFGFQTLFAHEWSSPACAVRTCRTFPDCRRHCFANDASAFPFLACNWHCSPHSGHGLSLSGGPGFFASPIMHSRVSFHRRFVLHFSGISSCRRSSPRI